MARFTHDRCAVYFYLAEIGGNLYHDASSNRIMINSRRLNTSDISRMVSLYKSTTGNKVTSAGVRYAVNLIADEDQRCGAPISDSPEEINYISIKSAVRQATAREYDRGLIVTLPLALYSIAKILGCDKKELKPHINLIRSYLIDIGFRQRWESAIHGSEAREIYYKRGHAPLGAYSHSTPIPRG